MLKFWQFQSTLIFRILPGERLKSRTVVLGPSMFPWFQTSPKRLLKITESWSKMKMMICMALPWEDSLSLIPRVLSDPSPLMMNRWAETPTKLWESFRPFNMPISTESSVLPAGSQDQRLLFRIKKRWKSISRICEKWFLVESMIQKMNYLKG